MAARLSKGTRGELPIPDSKENQQRLAALAFARDIVLTEAKSGDSPAKKYLMERYDEAHTRTHNKSPGQLEIIKIARKEILRIVPLHSIAARGDWSEVDWTIRLSVGYNTMGDGAKKYTGIVGTRRRCEEEIAGGSDWQGKYFDW
ncbi:hypothetical protein HOY80DRAFT_1133907 [Tuber brumale]|nr:hypothetical protein HOY80DRAFT_1133907 [Tuber brumale]